MAVAHAQNRAISEANDATYHRDSIKGLNESVNEHQQELALFFGSKIGSKAEIRERIKDYKDTIRYFEVQFEYAKKSAAEWKNLAPIFNAISKNFVDEEILADQVKNYAIKDETWGSDGLPVILKNDGSLNQKFGLNFFKNIKSPAEQKQVKELSKETHTPENSTIEDRLLQLNMLLQNKLINKSEYTEKKIEILSEL